MHRGVLTVVAAMLVKVVVAEPCSTCHHHHRHGGGGGGGALAVSALAFVGGYELGRQSQYNYGGRGSSDYCPDCGCGGCGESCGWCGGNYGRRRRRSIQGFLEDAEIKKTYSQIAAEDKDQCGLRLVCELAQKDPRELAEDEIQILTPYKGTGESDGTTYGNYDEAAWHGQEGHSCPTNYPLCAFTAQQVMEEYRSYTQDHSQDGDK
ncbi:uncharacterized protein [Procambarus clarkii]|uniref:uncharacterized protein n=1 Tax=Procambarus clarkii TaxID=6728 RepID=UPI001E678152|nr:uncharacterized protein LOC123765042 [Procambarus clarkii]